VAHCTPREGREGKSVFAVAVWLPQYISIFLCIDIVRKPFPTVVGALFVLALVKPRAGAKTLHCLTAATSTHRVAVDATSPRWL
jgi:hypothetical protein